MPKPSRTAQNIADQITDTVKNNSRFTQSFGDETKLKNTVNNILKMDTEFEKNDGVFFQAGGNSFDTAAEFTKIHVQEYRDNTRPSLPMLASFHADKIGLDDNDPMRKAMIMVATRAELKQMETPDYHNQNHYADVTAMAANFVHANNEMVANGEEGGIPLPKNEQAMVILAAIGHDIDHDGHGNPEGNHYFNEEKSFTLMVPLLEEAGLEQKEIQQIHTMLLTTSPNGPHAVMKDAAKSFRENGNADFNSLKDNDKFPELKVLAESKNLTQMAAMLSDADLYASAGAGMDSSVVMSAALTKEVQKSGVDMDLTTDGARSYFLDGIVGKEGFASNAARKIANPSMEKLRDTTMKNLSKIKPNTP